MMPLDLITQVASVTGLCVRDYQKDACEAAWTQLDGNRSTIIVWPTGTGKTVGFALFAAMWIRADRGRVLILAHREELIDQAKDKIERFTGLRVAVEMGDRRVTDLGNVDVVVASVQTLCRETRRQAFEKGAFGLIVIDEAHHATSDSYVEIVNYFASAKILGVTATPDRLDKTGLGKVFETVAHVYEIRDAIKDGYLVPIRQKTVQVDSMDLSQVRSSYGDLNESDLEQILTSDSVLHQTAAPLVQLAENRPTIVFTASVGQAMALATVLDHYKPGASVAVSGRSNAEERTGAVGDFTAGRKQFLVNCALFTEGFDAPPTSCVAVARPTKSRALYTQMVGRGTRILGATYSESVTNGKSDLLVLDFVGQAGRHSLVNAVDILDGGITEALRARVLKILRDDPEMDILTAAEEAEAQMAEEARIKATFNAKVTTIDVDPFAARDPFLVLGASKRAGRWGGIAPTEKQVDILTNAGVDTAGLDRGQASALLEKIIERRVKGLCTFKMAKILAKHGLNPDVSFANAQRAITAIAASRWRVPAAIANDPIYRLAVAS